MSMENVMKNPVALLLMWSAFMALLVGMVVAIDDGRSPCDVDAPMERAQCRAERGW